MLSFINKHNAKPDSSLTPEEINLVVKLSDAKVEAMSVRGNND
jgi:hypothetical protein